MDKVSIIIPIYNVGDYLRECLDSCINQTYSNLEILCVNDGSTDCSPEIINEFYIKDNRIKVLNKSNGGLPSARKFGIENATGDYIFHLDGDDNIPIDAISSLMGKALEHNADIVIGDYYIYENDEKTYIDSCIDSTLNGEEYTRYILTKGLFNIWGKIIKKSLYDNDIEIPLDISIGEDLVHSYQLAYYSKKIVPVHSVCYNYYIRPSSMSASNLTGGLCDRSIYAVCFITKCEAKNTCKVRNVNLCDYVSDFIYTYMLSPYPINIRKDELKFLLGFLDSMKYKSKMSWKKRIVISFAYMSLSLSKLMANSYKIMAKFKRSIRYPV